MRICVRRRRFVAARRRSPRDTSAWRSRTRAAGEASVRWISTTPRRLRCTPSRPTSVPRRIHRGRRRRAKPRGAAGTRTLCAFGAATPSTAAEISSALVACESPAHPGVASLEVSAADEGQQFTAAGVVFEFGDAPATRGASPARGPPRAAPSSRSTSTPRRPSDARRADSAPSRPFSRDESAARRCCAPARARRGRGAARHDVQPVDYSVGAASFKYGHAAIVVDVYPSTGPASGGTEVFAVVESMDDAEPSCSFGAVAVRAEVGGRVETCGERLVATTNGIYSDAAGTDVLVSPGRQFVSASKCVGHVVLRCVAPASFPGVVSFDVDFGGGDAVSFGFDVDAEDARSRPPSVPSRASPSCTSPVDTCSTTANLCAVRRQPAHARRVRLVGVDEVRGERRRRGFASAEVSVSAATIHRRRRRVRVRPEPGSYP